MTNAHRLQIQPYQSTLPFPFISSKMAKELSTARKTVFANPKGKELVDKGVAEQKIKERYEQRRASTIAQKKFTAIAATSKTQAQLKRETHAAMIVMGSDAQQTEYLDRVDDNEYASAKALEDHLRSTVPFNGRWDILKTLNAGTYGIAFLVQDNKTFTKAVIKVARVAIGETGNTVAEWESFVLEKMFKVDPSANIVRLLDKGMLQDPDGNRLEFMAVELCELSVRGYISENCGPNDRKYRVLRVALGSLKGVFDLHKQGILHRDIKPDNMGMIKSDDEYVCVLYDLGMARMYSDGDACLRPPRTVVTFRGTPEWATGNAIKGREQTRFDDLIAWLYVIIELFDPTPVDSNDASPFPWDFCPNNKKAMDHLKTIYAPARLLLKHCPNEFYTIYTYLMCANRLKGPDYAFIANLVSEAMNVYKSELETPTVKKHRTKTGRTQETLGTDIFSRVKPSFL